MFYRKKKFPEIVKTVESVPQSAIKEKDENQSNLQTFEKPTSKNSKLSKYNHFLIFLPFKYFLK